MVLLGGVVGYGCKLRYGRIGYGCTHLFVDEIVSGEEICDGGP